MSKAADHPELKAFPKATQGMQRFVIVLPEKQRSEEDGFQVELLPGKMMQTDGVNRVRIGTKIETKPLQGWGYTFYEVTGSDLMMSTKIGVPSGTQMINSFVSGTPLLIRYNSRLPIVIYAPNGHEIRYRIWQADESYQTTHQG